MDLTKLSLEELINNYLQIDKNEDLINTFLEKVKIKIIPLLYYFGVKKEEDIEELSVEILFEVYKSLNRFKNEAKFNTFLFKIVKNQCLNYFRKLERESKKRSQTKLELINKNDNTIINEVEEKIFEKEIKKEINGLIQKMPEEYSICLYKKYWEDKTIEQISKEVGISISLVKVRIYRGKKWLKKRLKIKI